MNLPWINYSPQSASSFSPHYFFGRNTTNTEVLAIGSGKFLVNDWITTELLSTRVRSKVYNLFPTSSFPIVAFIIAQLFYRY
jgi:hypothetical protein